MRDFAGLHFSIDCAEDAQRIGTIFEPGIDLPVEPARGFFARISKANGTYSCLTSVRAVRTIRHSANHDIPNGPCRPGAGRIVDRLDHERKDSDRNRSPEFLRKSYGADPPRPQPSLILTSSTHCANQVDWWGAGDRKI